MADISQVVMLSKIHLSFCLSPFLSAQFSVCEKKKKPKQNKRREYFPKISKELF